jgi:hypothetical protein
MSGFWLTREERTTYEKRRRDRVIQESRDYRVMQGWLLALYPDIMTDFLAFNEKLRKENPVRKDLTTSPMFRRFVREKTGTFCCFVRCVTVS